MKEQSDDKAAKATTTIKSTPVKPSKDEISEQELHKATGGAIEVHYTPQKPDGSRD